MRAVILAAALAGAWVSGSAAQTAPSTLAAPAPADAAGANDPDKVVCKSLPPPTGTRIGTRRICQTQGEWDAQQRQHQQDLLLEQGRGAVIAPPPG